MQQVRDFPGKDSIRILDGDFTVTAGKDALHAENEDDKEKGFVYIAGGTFALASSGDGISASGDMTLLDGTYTITAGGGSENGEDHQEERPGGSGRSRGTGRYAAFRRTASGRDR